MPAANRGCHLYFARRVSFLSCADSRNGKPYLEAANRRYKPLYPTTELRIAAVVKGVVRKY